MRTITARSTDNGTTVRVWHEHGELLLTRGEALELAGQLAALLGGSEDPAADIPPHQGFPIGGRS